TGTRLDATLGFLNLAVAQHPVGLPTGLFGSFTVDLQGDSGKTPGRLGIFDIPKKLVVVAGFNASAHADLDASVQIGKGTDFPKVSTEFLYDQVFVNATLSTASGFSVTFGSPPRIVFKHVSLDLGTFISSVAKPILEKVQVVTKPLAPVIK